MIRAFRTSEPLNAVWLLLVVFLLRIPLFFVADSAINLQYAEPLSSFFFSFLEDALSYPVVNIVITGILICLQALWLNYLVLKYTLLFRNSYLPALFYVVMISIFPSYAFLNAAILSNFFALWIIDKLFSLYKTHKALSSVFDVGLIISIASMFYFPCTVWLLMIWLSLIMFRPFVWREWMVGFFGFMVPYVFVALAFFLADNFPGFLKLWEPLRNRFPDVLYQLQLKDFIPLIPIFFSMALAANKLRVNFYRNVIQVRKSQQLLMLFLLLSAIAFYIQPAFGISHFILLAAPLATFLSYYFLVAKKVWLAETLFWAIALSIGWFQVF